MRKLYLISIHKVLLKKIASMIIIMTMLCYKSAKFNDNNGLLHELQVDNNKFDNKNEDKVCFPFKKMSLVGHVLDHMLDHILDHMLYHVLDEIIIDLVTTMLQLPSFLSLALTNK